jgi:hypothetical protein
MTERAVVRCKFIVSSKTEAPTGGRTAEEPYGARVGWQIKMGAIWEGADADGKNIAKENHIFSDATPSGELTMFINNPEAAAALKTGECYYMDFTPAGLPDYAKPKAA